MFLKYPPHYPLFRNNNKQLLAYHENSLKSQEAKKAFLAAKLTKSSRLTAEKNEAIPLN